MSRAGEYLDGVLNEMVRTFMGKRRAPVPSKPKKLTPAEYAKLEKQVKADEKKYGRLTIHDIYNPTTGKYIDDKEKVAAFNRAVDFEDAMLSDAPAGSYDYVDDDYSERGLSRSDF